MKKLQKLLAVTAMMSMLVSPAYSQPEEAYYDDNAAAYDDSSSASDMSVWIPIGALAVAGIIIATTSRNHHHGGHGSSSSSSSHSHCGSSSL